MLRFRRRNRVVFAVALAVALFFADSAARLFLVLSAPHLAPLVIPAESKLITVRMTYDGYLIAEDHSGPMYHIANNIRRTVGQPALYNRTVWIFGNSGTFGLYVADADTMESRLQSLLNQANIPWRVVNTANSGEYAAGEYARLRSTPIRPGDMVVFDDGALDLVYDRCADGRFAVLQLACQVSYSVSSTNAKAVADYNRIVGQAQAFSGTRGATFYHFLQPTPYPQYERGANGIRLVVPDSLIMDAFHLTADGERVEARAIYDALTLV